MGEFRSLVPPYFNKSGTHLFLYIKEIRSLCKSAKKEKYDKCDTRNNNINNNK